MKKRPTLLISITFTIFLLAAAGALAVRAASEGRFPFSAAPVESTESAALLEREAAYQALIEQANQQLEQAKATQQALASQLAEADENNANSSNRNNSQMIPAEYAAEIALAVAVYPETLKGTPELVSFEGKTAYEAQFEKGAIYVDAITGEVLLNGTQSLEPQEIDTQTAVQIAKDYLGLDDIYQADEVVVSGVPLYRVIFSAGHFVYIDHTGQIVYVQMVSQTVGTTSTSTGSTDSGSSSHSDDHHEDDHEDEHDDD